jgi:hypothetical protein
MTAPTQEPQRVRVKCEPCRGIGGTPAHQCYVEDNGEWTGEVCPECNGLGHQLRELVGRDARVMAAGMAWAEQVLASAALDEFIDALPPELSRDESRSILMASTERRRSITALGQWESARPAALAALRAYDAAHPESLS